MKTVEQAAAEYAKPFRHYEYGEIMCNGIEGAFEAGVEFAQRWISVEEEMPCVLCTEFLVKGNFIFNDKVGKTRHEIATLTKCIFGTPHFEIPKGFKVTHWRHIELK